MRLCVHALEAFRFKSGAVSFRFMISPSLRSLFDAELMVMHHFRIFLSVAIAMLSGAEQSGDSRLPKIHQEKNHHNPIFYVIDWTTGRPCMNNQ